MGKNPVNPPRHLVLHTLLAWRQTPGAQSYVPCCQGRLDRGLALPRPPGVSPRPGGRPCTGRWVELCRISNGRGSHKKQTNHLSDISVTLQIYQHPKHSWQNAGENHWACVRTCPCSGGSLHTAAELCQYQTSLHVKIAAGISYLFFQMWVGREETPEKSN